MFRALLAHPQKAILKRHLVYCVRVMSAGCTTTGVVLCTDVQRYTVNRTIFVTCIKQRAAKQNSRQHSY
jgi:hypothetical protein